MLNIAYRHLRAPLRHEAGCRERCAPSCDVAAFETQLDQPVTAADRRAEEHRQQRIDALKRGEILA